ERESSRRSHRQKMNLSQFGIGIDFYDGNCRLIFPPQKADTPSDIPTRKMRTNVETGGQRMKENCSRFVGWLAAIIVAGAITSSITAQEKPEEKAQEKPAKA